MATCNLDCIDKLNPLVAAFTSLAMLAGQASCCSSEDVANILYVLNEQFDQTVAALNEKA